MSELMESSIPQGVEKDPCIALDKRIAKLEAALAAEREKVRELEQDARRYRYWRDNHGWTGYFDDGLTNEEEPDAVDAAIDAALANIKGGEHE